MSAPIYRLVLHREAVDEIRRLPKKVRTTEIVVYVVGVAHRREAYMRLLRRR